MSKLRDNLELLKRDHDALKYPGDLAADVDLDTALAGRRSTLRIGPLLAMAAAVAVAATVWIMLPARQDEHFVIEKPPATATVEHVGVVPSSDELIVAQMPATPVEALAAESAPAWSDVQTSLSPTAVEPASSMTMSMPYQSLSMPSLGEIDRAISASADGNQDS
jgi:hypothetical protein